MLRTAFLAAVLIVVGMSRCSEPRSPLADKPKPRVGDTVHLRGTIGEDVDCKLLRLDDGTVYSLSGRVPAGLRSGDRVCVNGTVSAVTQCLTQPSIEVDTMGNWSSCP